MNSLIEDDHQLQRFLSEIVPLEEIALDTEADSLHCYFEKLCLIQISTPSRTVLIDPLAEISLITLFDALRNKRVVFHGADYDLRLLTRLGDFQTRDIFDTMIAARLLGYEELGLAALVERFFQVKLSKGSQKANWGRRPLPRQMVEYAMNDTRFLLPLAKILEEEVMGRGRQEWLRQSLERMLYSVRNPKEKDRSKAWQIAGSAALEPVAQAVLRTLWYWRDAEAREWNRPPFHVMSNSDLLKIAELSVKGAPFSISHLPVPRRERFEQTLAAALKIPEAEWPTREKFIRARPNKQALKEFDRLKQLRDDVAKREKLNPAVIAPKAALEAIAFQNDFSGLMNWQKELLSTLQDAEHYGYH
ncbi:MAG: hypothetical protein C5B47_02720 [Verrucomicrobia bacterium]|nr:MAG: hypothetical protein C5B47_02720 [Verrucomicrobiota bacterium]